MSDIPKTKESQSKLDITESQEEDDSKSDSELTSDETVKDETKSNKNLQNAEEDNISKTEEKKSYNNEENTETEKRQDVNFDLKEEIKGRELNSEKGSTKNTNTPSTPHKRLSISRAKKYKKEKEIFIQKGKNKLQERPDRNKVKYLSEEEINLAFQWFTKGNSVITPRNIKDCFDTFFTDIPKNDKKYYIEGGIKNDTRHLINTREEKLQSEMFNSTQSIASLKKMLIKYPFKMKDYENAFSILCGGDLEEEISNKTINKYIEILKENNVPIKNGIDKILRCFDKDKDGVLGISDLYKMKLSDLNKITDDFSHNK
ncbi:hypothetical protein H8356DRAFT_1424152 [Neocallimastix lanati (nom. inval.)]|jgi:hypothetical protein|nr:hypothetical protein H8356DRAFT_1424152 [Neocallimastix sp. JGI-2020a]